MPRRNTKMAKRARMPKKISLVLIIAAIAIVALVLIGMNSVSIDALSSPDGNFIGEALAAMGKCTQMQKSTCNQLQQRCTTIKGTWQGDCSKCISKCKTK